MTTPPRTGEVFDLGYQRYEGAREGRGRARWAIFWDGVRTSLGLGRGASQKILPWTFIGFTTGPAIVIMIIAALATRFGGTGDVLGDLANRGYYEYALLPLLVFAASVAPALLCPDRRERVLSLYLVRPLSTNDYLVARFVAFLAVSMAVAYLPQVLIFSTLTTSALSPGRYIADNWLDVPRFLASGFIISILTTSLAMAAASLTDRRAFATAGALGLILVLAAAAGLIGNAMDSGARYVEMLQIPPTIVHMNNWVFGEPSGDLHGSAYLLALLGLAGLFSLVMWQRYRRITQ